MKSIRTAEEHSKQQSEKAIQPFTKFREKKDLILFYKMADELVSIEKKCISALKDIFEIKKEIFLAIITPLEMQDRQFFLTMRHYDYQYQEVVNAYYRFFLNLEREKDIIDDLIIYNGLR